MHVKLLVNSFPRASETFLFNLVTGLEKEGVVVTVCATVKAKDTGLFAHRLKDWSGNIQYISLKPVTLSVIVRSLQFIVTGPLLLFRMVRKKGVKKGFSDFYNVCSLLDGKPDIVHFSFSGLGITYLECLPYLQKFSVKTMVSCRGTAEKVKPLLDPQRGISLRKLFSRIDMVHCVSRDMEEGLVSFGLIPEKTFINYPSIDVSVYNRPVGKSESRIDELYILTTGSLYFAKGYIFALQAMKILKEKGFRFTYHILGEGPDRPMITFAIHELGLSENVILHGRVSSVEVMEELKKADIFLLSSVYEGVANAALEAMAMEVPLVSTKAGGMAEVVQHRQNGMIVNCFDGVAIANAIEELFLSQELRDHIKRNGRDTVKMGFTLEKQIGIFIEKYKGLLSSSSS